MAVLAVAIHLVHGVQVKRNAKGLLERSRRAEDAGDMSKAEDYLQRYLASRPDDVEALVRYAGLIRRSDLSAEGVGRALAAYEKAVRLAPDRADVRRRVVDLAIEVGRPEVAAPHLAELARSAPEDGEIAYLRGLGEESAERFREASALYEEAVRKKPTQVEAYTRLADILRRRLNDPGRADALMDAPSTKGGIVAANPGSSRAYLARARYCALYRVPGADVAADVAKAQGLAPDDPDVLLVAARLDLSKNDVASARRHLEHGVARSPGAIALYEALAELERGAGRGSEAADWLRRGIAALPADRGGDRVRLEWTLADLFIQAGRLDEADKLIATLKGKGYRPGLVEFLEASGLAADVADWGPARPGQHRPTSRPCWGPRRNSGGWPAACSCCSPPATGNLTMQRPSGGGVSPGCGDRRGSGPASSRPPAWASPRRAWPRWAASARPAR